MSTEKQMSEDERLTRLAARAIGHDLTGWKWSDAQRSLFTAGNDLPIMGCYHSFGPLTNPAHAYLVEDLLMMNVAYVVGKTATGTSTSIRVSCDRHGAAVFRTKREDQTSLQARMAAITQYAALCAIMEDENGAISSLATIGQPNA